MPVIAVTNHKGGVGKTTTSLNLAAAIHEAGKRVLIVDLDSQANLTICAGFKNLDKLDVTLSEVLAHHTLGQPITPAFVRSAIQTLPSGLDVLTSNRKLIRSEQDLTSKDGRQYALRTILETIQDNYDFIVIDCSPSAGVLTENALAAADYVLVPVQAEYLAMQGLAYLIQSIVQSRLNHNPRLQILGVLMTMVDLRTLHSREIVAAVRQVFQSQIRVFYSMIKVDVKLREASKASQTIFQYSPTSKAAEAYTSLAEEILAILPDYEGDPERGTIANPELVEQVEETATRFEMKVLTGSQILAASADYHEEEQSNGYEDEVEDDASEQSPEMTVVACPKLGFADQPDQHAFEPHLEHRCFARETPLNLSIKRQESICLSGQHGQCPFFMRHQYSAAFQKTAEEPESVPLTRRLFGAFKLFSR
jgi:chromosome partitioning protein